MSNSTIKNLKASSLFYLARGSNMVVALLILVLISVAYWNSFIQDDAFISFRYAQNLVQQGELTWNPAEEERVEGYTNFLWTMMIALAIALGMDPVVAAKLLGLFFAVGTLFFTYRLSLLMFQSRIPALVSMILLGTNYTFSAYATGGLETQLQTFLIVASTYLALLIVKDNRWRFAYLITLTFLSSAAILTRLDSIIPLIILFPFILWNLVRHPMPVKNRVMNAIYLVLPMLLIVSSYLLWKYAHNQIHIMLFDSCQHLRDSLHVHFTIAIHQKNVCTLGCCNPFPNRKSYSRIPSLHQNPHHWQRGRHFFANSNGFLRGELGQDDDDLL